MLAEAKCTPGFLVSAILAEVYWVWPRKNYKSAKLAQDIFACITPCYRPPFFLPASSAFPRRWQLSDNGSILLCLVLFWNMKWFYFGRILWNNNWPLSQFSASSGKPMQISVYRSQNSVRRGMRHPFGSLFCERYTLICMGLPAAFAYLLSVRLKRWPMAPSNCVRPPGFKKWWSKWPPTNSG